MGQVAAAGREYLMEAAERAAMWSAFKADNPGKGGEDLQIYFGAALDYCEAETNIRAHGNVCLHPRTGAPVENPYLKIKASAVRLILLSRFGGLAKSGLWRGLERMFQAAPPGVSG